MYKVQFVKLGGYAARGAKPNHAYRPRLKRAESKPLDKLRFPCEPQASGTHKFVCRNSSFELPRTPIYQQSEEKLWGLT